MTKYNDDPEGSDESAGCPGNFMPGIKMLILNFPTGIHVFGQLYRLMDPVFK